MSLRSMEFPVRIPFVEAMGFELLSMHDGEAEIALTLRPDQQNSLSMAHGGVTMTLLVYTMAMAATARGHHDVLGQAAEEFAPGIRGCGLAFCFPLRAHDGGSLSG